MTGAAAARFDPDFAPLAAGTTHPRSYAAYRAYAAAMGGLDVVVFTAGIGENDPRTRAQSLEGLEFLGIELDERKNGANGTIISTPNSRAQVLVIPTDEALMIARGALEVVGSSAVPQMTPRSLGTAGFNRQISGGSVESISR